MGMWRTPHVNHGHDTLELLERPLGAFVRAPYAESNSVSHDASVTKLIHSAIRRHDLLASLAGSTQSRHFM